MLRRLDGGILGGTQPAMPAVAAPGMGISGHEHLTGTQDVSALGETFAQTPLIVPIRGHLDSIKRLLKGDVYIGRGSRQRSLPKSRYCNTFKVSQVGRAVAISSFRQALLADPALHNSLWTLSGTRLVCHCRATEDCHGDVLVEEFKKLYPAAHDRNQPRGVPPGHEILSFLARLREEPESDEGSSPDEGVPMKFAGHRGISSPMMVGVGYVQREFCDGQSLASPGRWPPGSRVYPSSPVWSSVQECFWRFTAHYGTEKLLVDLAMGKVEESPFPPDEIQQLKQSCHRCSLLELVSPFFARAEIVWMFQSTTDSWTYCFVPQMILRSVSEIMLKASRWVPERECQGCLHYIKRRKNGDFRLRLTPRLLGVRTGQSWSLAEQLFDPT